MSPRATIHRFEIALADADRGVYESLDLRVARHPSESASFLIVRVLAYCLEHAPGIAFSKGGVSDVAQLRQGERGILRRRDPAASARRGRRRASVAAVPG